MKFNVRDLCEIVIIAALYVALTLVLMPISYGAVQFRVSEALILLVCYKRKYSISLILGCFIANLFSPVGWVDIIFGTLATALAVIPMMYIKKLEISSLFPSIINGIVVGLELSLVYDIPIILTMLEVFIGEFVVVTLIGIPLFKTLEKNDGFMRAFNIEKSDSYIKDIKINIYLSFISLVLVVILFFRLPLDNSEYSLFTWLKDDGYYVGIIFILMALLFLLSNILLDGTFAFIFDIIIALLYILVFIITLKDYKWNAKALYYLNILPAIYFIVVSIFRFKNFKRSEISDSF